ncbi:hypothetical protein BKA64DRAFT_712515 [Cadophora sp. MPI-SDFR-AT-0126]|nr:hypothetical protein BKA64DRAFT_712515 [Leotiomycetes sp. MPI-SDFR-AT-0126]
MNLTLSPPFPKSREWPPQAALLTEIPQNAQLPLTASAASSFLRSELDISRLDAIHQHLWLAGRLNHIRPLHKQHMLHRSIIITEDSSMHLVWFENNIFVKPIPHALLSWEFWQRFICSGFGATEDGTSSNISETAPFYASAYGLLLSYTHLIKHPSDYQIAISHNLLPDMSWRSWSLLSASLSSFHPPTHLALKLEPRWQYGELRLSRLNLIYKLTLRGYSYSYMFTEYRPYFSKNFQLLLLAFAYCSVALAAMQVIMSSGEPAAWLTDLCFRFSVLVIVFVFAVVGGIVGLFLGLFVYHFGLTLVLQRRARVKQHLA